MPPNAITGVNELVEEFDFSYCLEIVEARAVSEFELNCLQELKELEEYTFKNVFIYDYCTSPIDIFCSDSYDPACQTIKDGLLLPTSQSITPIDKVLYFNEEYQVIAFINSEPLSSHPLSSQVNWSSSDENIATINDQGLVTTHSTEGTSIITASICDQNATDTIHVSCKNPFEEGCQIWYSKRVEGVGFRDDEDCPHDGPVIRYDLTIQMHVGTENDGKTYLSIWILGNLFEEFGGGGGWDFNFTHHIPDLNGNTFQVPFESYGHPAFIAGTIYNNYIDVSMGIIHWTTDGCQNRISIRVRLDELKQAFSVG